MEIVESIDLPTSNITGDSGYGTITVPIDWSNSSYAQPYLWSPVTFGFPAVAWDNSYVWIIGRYYSFQTDQSVTALAKVNLATKSIVSTFSLPYTYRSAVLSIKEEFGSIWYSSSAISDSTSRLVRIDNSSLINLPTFIAGRFLNVDNSLNHVHSLGISDSISGFSANPFAKFWDIKINKDTNIVLAHEIHNPNYGSYPQYQVASQTSDLYSNYYAYFNSAGTPLVIVKHNAATGGFEASWTINVQSYFTSMRPYIKYYNNNLYVLYISYGVRSPYSGIVIVKINRANGSIVEIQSAEYQEIVDATSDGGYPMTPDTVRTVMFDDSLPMVWIAVGTGTLVIDLDSAEIVDYARIGFYATKVDNNEAWVDKVVVSAPSPQDRVKVPGSGEINKIISTGMGWSVGSIG